MKPWEMDYGPEEPQSAQPAPWELPWDVPEEQPKKKSGNDFTNALKIGVQKLPGAVTGIADTVAGVAGFDRPFDKLTDKLGEQTGFQPEKWAKENEQNYSDELKAAQENVNRVWDDKTKSWVDIAKTYIDNPIVTGKTLVESLPSTVAGGALGRVIKALTPVSGVVAGGAGEGVMAAGGVMNEVPEHVDPQRAAVASLAAGVGTAGIGVAGGKIASKLGTSDIDTLLAGGARASTAVGDLAEAPMYQRFLAAAAQEGLAEEMPQSAIEKMAANYAEGKDLMTDVPRAATEGAITGAVMGSGASLLGRSNPEQSQQELMEDAQRPETRAAVEQMIAEHQSAAQPLENDNANQNTQTTVAANAPVDGVPAAQTGVPNADIQENGNQNRPDPGTDQPVLGMHGERVAVSGQPADASGGGTEPPAGVAGSNNAGEGQNGPALNPYVFEAAAEPTHNNGLLSKALDATRKTVADTHEQGAAGWWKNIEDRITQSYFDNKHGVLRFLPSKWTENVNGNRQATARAKMQAQEYAIQMGKKSISDGGIRKNEEGMFEVVRDDNNIRNLFMAVNEIPAPQGMTPHKLFNGIIHNLSYYEREQSLAQRQAAARAALDEIALAPQTTTYEERRELESRRAAAQRILDEEYRRPAEVTDEGIEQAQRFAQLPEVARALNMLRAINRQNIDMYEQGAKISADTANEWRQHQFYVPLDRIMQLEEDPTYEKVTFGTQGGAATRSIKTFRGSERQINDVFESLIAQRLMMTEGAIRNDANLSALNALENEGKGGVTRLEQRPRNADNIVRVFDQGEPVYYEVGDPLAYRSFLGLAHKMPDFVKAAENITHFFREAIMLSPDAIARNMIRDAEETWVYNYTDRSLPGVVGNIGKQFVTNGRGGRFQLPEAEVAKFGITGAKEFTTAEREMDRILRETRRGIAPNDWAGNATAAVEAAVSAGFHRWQNVATRAELASRNHIYEEVLKRTGSKTEAEMAAINLLDFRRRGDAAAITFLKQTIPFINSQLQGLHKIYRAVRWNESLGMDRDSARKAMALKGLKIALVASVYTALMSDDDDWMQTDRKARDTSILVPTGEPGRYFRIPLPFEIGSMFWSVPANAVMSAKGKQDGRELIDSLKGLVGHSLPNLIPQVAKPLLESLTNYDFFTDGPIVPSAMKGLDPALQTRETTTETAKGISSATGISPLKADHLLRGYFGSLGQYAIAMVDGIYKRYNDAPDATDKPWHRYPGLRSMFTDPLKSNSKDEFYKMRDMSRTVHDTVEAYKKRYDAEGLKQYIEKDTRGIPNKRLYAAYPLLDKSADMLSKMLSQQQAISRNTNADSKMRRLQIEQLKKQEKAWVEQFVPQIKKALDYEEEKNPPRDGE